MSVRVTAITGTCVDGSGAPNPTGTVSLHLLIPGGGLAVDTAGELINRDPPNPVPDPTTAVWTANVIPPGDITPAGCEWQVSQGAVQSIVSPAFAYVAGPVNVTSWISSPSRLGLIKMYLTAVEANALADTGATFGVTINADAIWTGTGGSGQLIQAGATPISTTVDSGGDVFYYLVPQLSLNPSSGYYQTPTRRGTLYFTAPAAYTGDAGTYASGTTYAANAVVRDPANNYEPYISLAGGNIGHTPSSSPSFWADYPGERITAFLTGPSVPGTIALTQAGIAADPAVATGAYTNPPATLQDQLRQLTQIQARHVTASTYTVVADDDVIDADGTANTVAITLPTAVGWSKLVAVKAINITHAVTITTTSAQTIDGAAPPLTPTLHTIYVFYSNGANWEVYATNGAGGGGAGADATPSAVGMVQIDQSPPSGHPRALTDMSRFIPNGLLSLGTDGMLSTMTQVLTGTRGVFAETSRWVESGLNPLFGGSNGAAAQEPNILVEGGVIKLWYTHSAGSVDARLAYATCASDPTVPGNWTDHGDVLGQGASSYSGVVEHASINKFNGIYYCWFADNNNGNLWRATSADGVAWNSPVQVIADNQVAWSVGWNNTVVWQVGAVWWMLIEGQPSGGLFDLTIACSADGLAWTFPTANYLLTLRPGGSAATTGGPWLMTPPQRDGLYHLWYHANAINADTPTDIYHATAADPIGTWTILNGGNPIISHPGGYDQVADPCVFEWRGQTYIVYERVNNGISLFEICIASATCTVAQLIDGVSVAGPAALADLTDVSLSSPTDGQLLRFNAATGLWGNHAQVIYGPLVDSGGLLIRDSAGTPILAAR